MQNDGGIKRGDRADTGDLAANPDENGQGVAGGGGGAEGHPTGNAAALGGSPGPSSVPGTVGSDLTEDMDGMTILDATDPRLGMTGLDGEEVEDWAADTGETVTEEELTGAATRDLTDRGSTLGKGHKTR